MRPVLVLSINAINRSPLVITVVPGTKGSNISRDFPTNVRISPADSGLPEETVFLCFQVRAIDPRRFPAEAAGQLSAEKMGHVERSVRYCLGL